jgi:HEAT repeat protein
MMEQMERDAQRRRSRAFCLPPFRFLAGALLAAVMGGLLPSAALAQLEYVARFRMEKQQYRLGEAIFCDFVIRNNGTHSFVFSYRPPWRAANQELKQEPHFTLRGRAGRQVFDPAPHLCGGAKGAIVYGSVTLPPGGTHRERWLLNQWGRFTRPGTYHLRAERHLPLYAVSAAGEEFSEKPAAFALALDDLSFQVLGSTAAERRSALEPYARILLNPDSPRFTEAFLVASTLPQPFLLDELRALAYASPHERRWNSAQALEGLARLGTPAGWRAILEIARGDPSSTALPGVPKGTVADDSARAYAILLLGEDADPVYLPALLRLATQGAESLRDDALRALGFFRDPRANRLLFEKLHSTQTVERVNAILGLRNLESKDAIPALLAMLDDPEPEVRQVANFALQNLTGEKFQAGGGASPQAARALARRWQAWWRTHEAGFVTVRQATCHDW